MTNVTNPNKTAKYGLMGKRSTLLLMALPCIVLLIIFSYVPLMGWSLAFFDYLPGRSLANSPFVGFDNFIAIFKEPELFMVLRNTLALSFIGLLMSPLPAIMAILFNEIRSDRFRKTVQSITTLPYFVSWILVYALASVFFGAENGVFTPIFRLFSDRPVALLTDLNMVWPLQTMLGVWKSVGFNSIIYLAAILSIDPGLYDAAAIDGAGRFQKMWHVTVPGIIPTFVVLLILSVGGMLSNGFEQYYVFYNPVVHSRIQVLDYYLWRIGFIGKDFSFSTALGITKTLVGLVLLFSANAIAKNIRKSSII